ncbi:Cap [Sanivirus suspensae]|nr:Cap [Forsythia suspensa CRESS virus]
MKRHLITPPQTPRKRRRRYQTITSQLSPVPESTVFQDATDVYEGGKETIQGAENIIYGTGVAAEGIVTANPAAVVGGTIYTGIGAYQLVHGGRRFVRGGTRLLNRLNPKKMKSTSSSAINQQSTRIAVKKTAKAAVKSKPVVKVPPHLRSQIKEVMNDEKYQGTFIERMTGIIARQYANVKDNTVSSGFIDGMANQMIRTFDHNEMPHQSCGWFSDIQPFFDTNNAEPPVVTGRNPLERFGLHFFTPLQIWDYVSKQYGEKQLSAPPSETDNNFGTISTSAGEEIRAARGLEVTVLKAYVELTFHNQSQRHITLELWHCVPKRKIHVKGPLQDFSDGIFELFSDASDPRQKNVTIQRTDDNANLHVRDALRMVDVDPTLSPSFKISWDYEKILVHISPGEKYSYKLNGPTNIKYDFTKFENIIQTLSPSLWGAFKGYGIYLMVRHQTDSQWFKNTKDAPDATESAFAMQPGFVPAVGELSCPVFVTSKAYCRYVMPDQVGGITPAVGTDFNLNTRRDRLTIYDKNNYILNSVTTANSRKLINLFDEENPAAVISSGGFRD